MILLYEQKVWYDDGDRRTYADFAEPKTEKNPTDFVAGSRDKTGEPCSRFFRILDAPLSFYCRMAN